MKQRDNLLGVLQNLYRRRRFIIYTCIAAGVLTAIISLFFPNYYRATTVFLAGSPDQANPQLIFSEGSREANYYGSENDIDRILTMAESNELLYFLVDSFRLYEHYEINPSRPKAAFKVREELLDHYEIKKTPRDAIELSIEDTDKELAAAMANAAREKIDRIVQRLIKKTQEKNLKTYEDRLVMQEKNLAVFSDSLIRLREEYGIYNTVSQGNYLTSALATSETRLAQMEAKLNVLRSNQVSFRGIRDSIAILQADIAGIRSKKDTLSKKLANFNIGMPVINTISKLYFQTNDQIAETQDRYERLSNIYEANIPATILVAEADVPIVKYRPKRSIIVIAAGFIAFFFCVVGILLLDAYKDINWKEVFKS